MRTENQGSGNPAPGHDPVIVKQARIAAAAARDVDVLVYAVSHELCVPVRHIDGFVAMLRKRAEGQLDEEGRQCLDKIAAACANMARMAEGLLTYARTTGGELKISPVVLEPMIRDVIEELQLSGPPRQIDWRMGDFPVIPADRMLLRRVLLQLLGNAIKVTARRADPRVEISAWATDVDVVICITDNGMGFDAKSADRLFRLFQHLRPSDEFDGVGVGLAIVARIVGRHGGSVWAEAVEDGGARFFVSLPMPTDGARHG